MFQLNFATFDDLFFCVRALLKEHRKTGYVTSAYRELVDKLPKSVKPFSLSRQDAQLLLDVLRNQEDKNRCDHPITFLLEDLLGTPEEMKTRPMSGNQDQAIKEFARREQGRLEEDALRKKRDAIFAHMFGITEEQPEPEPKPEPTESSKCDEGLLSWNGEDAITYDRDYFWNPKMTSTDISYSCLSPEWSREQTPNHITLKHEDLVVTVGRYSGNVNLYQAGLINGNLVLIDASRVAVQDDDIMCKHAQEWALSVKQGRRRE